MLNNMPSNGKFSKGSELVEKECHFIGYGLSQEYFIKSQLGLENMYMYKISCCHSFLAYVYVKMRLDREKKNEKEVAPWKEALGQKDVVRRAPY